VPLSVDKARERAGGQVCEIDMTEQINQRGCPLRIHHSVGSFVMK